MEDIRTTEVELIKYVQRVSFPQKRSSSLVRQRHVLRCSGSSGSIYKLRPWLDQRGILRVGGRLEYAPINFQAKHQILLPSNHHVSSLLIMVYHELVGNFGQEYVLASLLERYWIVKGRATVQRVLGNVLITKQPKT